MRKSCAKQKRKIKSHARFLATKGYNNICNGALHFSLTITHMHFLGKKKLSPALAGGKENTKYEIDQVIILLVYDDYRLPLGKCRLVKKELHILEFFIKTRH